MISIKSLKKAENRLILLSDFLTKREKTKGLPVEIGIELTNHCNLECIMCPHSEMVNKHLRLMGFMDFDLFKKIIDEVNPFAEIVYLHGFGESLLHPKLFEYIHYAKEKRVPLGLSTNATLLTKEKARQLLASGIDYLILAMDGATQKTYERIRLGANFEKTESNIKYFLSLAKKSHKPPFIVIQFINLPENEKEIDLFIKKWQGKGANVVRIKSKIALKDNEKKNNSNSQRYCFHIFRQLNITWDGYVMACCEDINATWPLGNIKKEKLVDIWNNEKMRFLRKINFRGEQNKVSICKKCTYPQPSKVQAVGVLFFDHLKVKKLLPYLERYLNL